MPRWERQLFLIATLLIDYINKAAALIGCGFTSVKEIATLCGFSDALYFSRVFKSLQGVSPKEFINNAYNIKQKDIS